MSALSLSSQDQVTTGCRTAASELHRRLEEELAEATQAAAECESLSFEISQHFGFDLAARAREEEADGYTLDTLAILRHQLDEARSRLADLLARDRERLHGLALTESFRMHAGQHRSPSTVQIDQMSSEAFTALIEKLLVHDGHCVLKPTEPQNPNWSLLVTTESGHWMAVTTQHWHNPNTWGQPAEVVNTAVLHRARRGAVAAGGDAIVVTNGGITRPARRYAAAQKIRLIDRAELQRWAEWGEPLTRVGAA